MKKLLLALVILIPYLPYIFIATSIDKVPGTTRAYNCTVKAAGTVKGLVWGTTSYNPIRGMFNYKQILVPVYIPGAEAYSASCGDKEILIGTADFLKAGEKIHAYTDTQRVTLFGKTVFEEESINQFGNRLDDGDNEPDGQVVVTLLIDDKETKMFDGKVISQEK